MILGRWAYYLLLPLIAAWALPCVGLSGADRRDQDGLKLDDLQALLSALQADEPAAMASSVSFKQIWEDAPQWQGKRVRLEGIVRRRFRQEAVGRFPALGEFWVETDSGDWVCGVSPGNTGMVETGDRVSLEGRFLRLIRYRSMDGDRLAPLVVGHDAPVKLADEARASQAFDPISSVKEWHVGVALLVFVAFVLGAQHLKRRPATGIRPGNLGADFWVEPDNSDGGSTPSATVNITTGQGGLKWRQELR